MGRSISFVVEGAVDTRFTVVELTDGSLRFDLEVLGTGSIGDLRGVFFDLRGYAAGSELSVTPVAGYEDIITHSEFDEESVDRLSPDANVKGQVARSLGRFDAGVEFGTPGTGKDDIQEVGFVLASSTGELGLDLFDLVDIGLRYQSVGAPGGERDDGAKIAGRSSGVARNDELDVDENTSAGVDLLANDTNGGQRTVTAVFDADGAFTAAGDDFERQVTVDGRHLGLLTVTAAGVATFEADGADVDSLGHDAVAEYDFGYTSTSPAGATATAHGNLLVLGLNDQPVAEDLAFSVSEDDTSDPGDLDAPDGIPAIPGDGITGAFEASDIDDGDTLSFEILGAPTDAFGNQYGSVVNNGDGTFTFDPLDDFQFLDSGESRDVTFRYVAIDDSGVGTAPAAPEESDTSDPKTVTITVLGDDDDPIDIADQLLFETTNQSMFGTGEALLFQPELPFLGFDTGFQTFDVGIVDGFTFSGDVLEGILEGIEAVAQVFADIGCGIVNFFGGDCEADVDLPSSISTPAVDLAGFYDFKVGLQPYFELTSGDVAASLPVDVVFTTPRQVEVGDTFQIGSMYSVDDGATFETNSPDVNFGLDFVFDTDVDVDLEFGASSFGGASSVGILDFDTQDLGPGKLGEPGFNFFDFSAADDLETTIDLPAGTGALDLNFPVIETEGGLVDADTLTSSGADDVAVLDVDVDRVLTNAFGLPPLGETFSEGLTIDVAGADVNLLSVELGYDIAAVNLISTLSAIQNFTLDIEDLPLVAELEDGSTVDGFSLGDAITIDAPAGFDADSEGDADGLIDFSVDVDIETAFANLTTLGFDLELFTGLLRLAGGITSDFFDGPGFSLFPNGTSTTADDFLLSDTFELFSTDTFATLFDETFALEGFNQDTTVGQFDVA